jgi:hypothetical protein
MYNIRFFYSCSENGTIEYLDNTTNEYGNVPSSEKFKKNEEGKNAHNYFELKKGYKKTHKGLEIFKNNFWKWCSELQKEGIHYEKYYNDYNAVELNFKRYSTNELKEYDIKMANFDEYSFMEKCYNAGIMYFDEQYKEKEVESYGYDFSAFYPNLLVSKYLQLPRNQGRKTKLQSIDYSNLDYGIYKVNVVCNHPDFNKVFCYSKHGYYTHLCLWFANFYKTQYDITLTLDTTIEYNALIYEKSDLINVSNIFAPWFKKMMEVKTKYKTNVLTKHLFTSL